MPKIKIKFSRIVEVEIPALYLSPEEEAKAIERGAKELDDLIMNGNFFISDMDVDIE